MKINLRNSSLNILNYCFYIVPAIILVAVTGFSFFYLLSSFAYLQNWYVSLNPCFYDPYNWSTFFNPMTKTAGNSFCIAAIFTSLSGLIYVFLKLKNLPNRNLMPITIEVKWKDALFPALLAVLQIFLWSWGQTTVSPSFDEVFSAVNCAQLPVFQCLSYYMLPNNHIFFNVLNSLLFHNATDHVFTGRIISLFAYLILVIWAYTWFAKQFKNRFAAFACAVVMAVQFSSWGFGLQARGYEIYALAQWGAFVSLFDYINTSRKKHLVLNTILCIMGYITIPSFLYYHVAQTLFMVLYQAVQKKFDFAFWKYQVIAVVFVFCFYLPAICFSGINALVGNKYILPSTVASFNFIKEIPDHFRSYVEYCFSNGSLSPTLLSLTLFLLPAITLFSRKKWLGFFVIVLVVSFMAIVFLMKKLPFHRNLVGQYSIILTVSILGIYQLVTQIKSRYSKPLFIGLMILLASFFVGKGYHALANNLYYDDPTVFNTTIKTYLNKLPKGAAVGCSTQAFYWYYLCGQNHIMAHQCPDGQEDYYVKQQDEQFPSETMRSSYKLQAKVMDYEVFGKVMGH